MKFNLFFNILFITLIIVTPIFNYYSLDYGNLDITGTTQPFTITDQRIAPDDSLVVTGLTQPFILNDQIKLDDGYLICGSVDIVSDEPHPPYSRAFLGKVDLDGHLIWIKQYGGDDYCWINDIQCTCDGYILVGSSGSRYGSSFLIIRTYINGDVVWMRCIGDSYHTEADQVLIIGNNYRVSGSIRDLDDNKLSYSVELDRKGDLVWEEVT